MKSFIKFFACCIALVSSQQILEPKADIDDRKHTIKQIVEENGFIFEEHNTITEDGYILTMHRIPKPNAPVMIPKMFRDPINYVRSSWKILYVFIINLKRFLTDGVRMNNSVSIII